MNGPNFAEIEARLRDNPSLADCFRHGQAHAAYGWSRRPWGHWTAEQVAAYERGWYAGGEGK